MILRARLLDRKLQAEMEARRTVRRDLVRGADRSEKVRTYNYAQVRLVYSVDWAYVTIITTRTELQIIE
jgi:protein subunit release factor A